MTSFSIEVNGDPGNKVYEAWYAKISGFEFKKPKNKQSEEVLDITRLKNTQVKVAWFYAAKDVSNPPGKTADPELTAVMEALDCSLYLLSTHVQGIDIETVQGQRCQPVVLAGSDRSIRDRCCCECVWTVYYDPR